ncbi:zf-TFIIB domain-containing protein, partial [bacterium]|nr:zf-TFIIB domain-containing protein [bacterium]
MKCINDQQEMLKKDYEAGIEIDECPECYSVWLDKGELEQIQECFHRDYTEELKKIPNDVVNAMRLAREKGKPIRTCPKCKMEMNRKEYGYCSQ